MPLAIFLAEALWTWGPVGRTLALRIDLPGEGWIALKCQAVYVNPEFGFAVSFVNVPPEVENKLARVVAQRREEPGAS